MQIKEQMNKAATGEALIAEGQWINNYYVINILKEPALKKNTKKQ